MSGSFDPLPLQTCIDLWSVRYGHGWVELNEEMLYDSEHFYARVLRVLSKENLVEHHYVVTDMSHRIKLKEGV